MHYIRTNISFIILFVPLYVFDFTFVGSSSGRCSHAIQMGANAGTAAAASDDDDDASAATTPADRRWIRLHEQRLLFSRETLF